MHPKNFPARKLRRQLLAAGEDITSEINIKLLDRARSIKTKKNRTKR